MRNICEHKVVIDKETYDIFSADTAFYSFMNERLYYTFNRLVHQDDLALLNEHVSGAQNGYFIMRLIEDEQKTIEFLVKINECGNDKYVELRFVRIESLLGARAQMKHSLNMKNAMLELYNDVYFEYNVAENRCKVFTISHQENVLAEITLEQFEEYFKDVAAEEQFVKLDTFLAGIRSGSLEHELEITGNILDKDDKETITHIKGVSVYNAGVYEYAVGYVHLGSMCGENVRKKVERDSLTGVLAKAEITNIAVNTIDVKKIQNITLAIIDVDYFKRVNDTFGHQTGDDVLKKVAAIIESEIGNRGLVGRFGGDEFFVLFYEAENMENDRERLRSLKNMVNSTFPPNDENKPAITLSIGCASYPKDAKCYEDLFMLADFSLYKAKELGRNRYIIYDREKLDTLEDIKQRGMTGNRINNRGNMSMGEVLCVMMDKVYSGEDYPIQKLLDDMVENTQVQRIMVYAGSPYSIVHMAGEQRLSDEIISRTEEYVSAKKLNALYDDKGCLIINAVSYMEGRDRQVYDMMVEQGILSVMQFKFTDKNGTPCILSFESVSRRVTWNVSSVHYYRLFTRLLSEYVLC